MGVDKAIAYSSGARIIQAANGVISIFFVARYLTGIEQGFYYTFGSIVAIQIFFELGFNTIITQYVAHEVVHLGWRNSVELEGESKYLSRLSSLLHFSVKWYLCFAGILFVTLLGVGFVFFDKYGGHDEVSWKLPWLLLAAGTALNLLLAPILAFLEGLGKVKEIARIRLYQQAIGVMVICGSLMNGAKLYVAGINWFVSLTVVLFILFYGNFVKLLWGIWCIPISDRVNYRQEIFPYQWKIAISWIGGYFIFQLFNPVLFATQGAVAAGQMGITLTALNGILSISLNWQNTKIPIYAHYIASKKYKLLDDLFFLTLKQSMAINMAISFLFFLLVLGARLTNWEIVDVWIADRFISVGPLLVMIIALGLNNIISSWAVYLRCHKREPYFFTSIVGGVLTSGSTILLAPRFGIAGVTVGYCLIMVILFCWNYCIFKKKRIAWHE